MKRHTAKYYENRLEKARTRLHSMTGYNGIPVCQCLVNTNTAEEPRWRDISYTMNECVMKMAAGEALRISVCTPDRAVSVFIDP